MKGGEEIQYWHGGEIPEEFHRSIVQQVAFLVNQNPGLMLPKRLEDILPQLLQRETVVAVITSELTVIGFITLWDLETDNVWEVGSLVVHPDHHGEGVGKRLVQELLDINDSHRMIATAKTARAINTLISGGMSMRDFGFLPFTVHEATCCCTGVGEGGRTCSKKDGKCRLLIAN